jgi:hypothetical protein
MLDTLGYLGTFSFEPFGPAVQKLPPDQLAAALEASFKYLGLSKHYMDSISEKKAWGQDLLGGILSLFFIPPYIVFLVCFLY